MTSVIKREYGNRDHQLAELRNFRLHIYPTLSAMLADASTAQGRAAYCIETDGCYFGKTGAWVGVTNTTSFQGASPDVGSLPTTDVNGTVRMVLDDGTGVGPTMWIYSTTHGGWHKGADPRIVLSDGTVKFTAIPGVANSGVVPSAATDLTTKAYVDTGGAALAAHIADASAHAAAIAAAIASHNTASNQHTAQFAAAIATAEGYSDAALNTHKADASAHASAISASATSISTAQIATHNADSASHGSNIDSRAATQAASAVATHASNPTAHAAEISGLIAAHNADIHAHAAGIAGPSVGGGGGGGGSSSPYGDQALTGQLVAPRGSIGSTAAIGHGTPVSPYHQVFGTTVWARGTAAMVWRPSTKISFSSGSVTFNNVGFTDKLIQVPTTSGLLVGMYIIFAGSGPNTETWVQIATIIDGTHLRYAAVSSSFSDGTYTCSMDAYIPDGIVVFGSKFVVSSNATLPVMSVLSIIGNSGGKAIVRVSGSVSDLSMVGNGDFVDLSGGTADDGGSYTIYSVDPSTGTLVLTTTLANDQTSPAGLATISRFSPLNNFTTAGGYYVDPTETTYGYSQNVGVTFLGTLLKDPLGIGTDIFMMDITDSGTATIQAISTSTTVTNDHRKIVAVDTTSGAVTVTMAGSTPNDFDEFIVFDDQGTFATHNCTVAFGGTPPNVVLSTNGIVAKFQYFNFKWRRVS